MMSSDVNAMASLLDDVRFRSGDQDEPHLFNPSGFLHGFEVCTCPILVGRRFTPSTRGVYA